MRSICCGNFTSTVGGVLMGPHPSEYIIKGIVFGVQNARAFIHGLSQRKTNLDVYQKVMQDY